MLLLSPTTFHVSKRRGETLAIKFSKLDRQLNPKIQLQIFQGNEAKSFFPEVHQDNLEYDFIEHVFNRRGAYDIHLLVNGDYVFTYHVEVVK
jgi:hypothetical protein